MCRQAKPSLSRCRAAIGMEVDGQPAPPVGHLLDVALAARAHAARRLAVGDAALDAATLRRGEVGRVGVAAVCDGPAHLALSLRRVLRKQKHREPRADLEQLVSHHQHCMWQEM